MKKIIEALISFLFGSKLDHKEEMDAIKCDCCKVWRLRVRDILKAAVRDKLLLFLMFFTFVLDKTGHLVKIID
jgi:hypothetical protein